MGDAGELAGEGRRWEAQQMAELAHQVGLVGEAVRGGELGPPRGLGARRVERGKGATA